MDVRCTICTIEMSYKLTFKSNKSLFSSSLYWPLLPPVATQRHPMTQLHLILPLSIYYYLFPLNHFVETLNDLRFWIFCNVLFNCFFVNQWPLTVWTQIPFGSSCVHVTIFLDEALVSVADDQTVHILTWLRFCNNRLRFPSCRWKRYDRPVCY